FAARRHIVPDWLGNRSPLGDGRVRALLTGIGEETGRRSFLEAYYATARALALQSRHVTEHLNAHGFAIETVALSGGHLRNPLLVRLYRDALGTELVLSDTPEPVLLGTATAATIAAGLHSDLFGALDAMAPEQRSVAADAEWRRSYDADYRTYLKLFDVRNDVETAARSVEVSARAKRS
ncbi:MAG: ribulokinase, partial [Rhizobiaceae bacterium]|nr:ribulokinase [Rhizobiaceae bacterium]